MKKWKNNLDEMQEMELLQIEHKGCWLAFWLLLATMALQLLVYGVGHFEYIVGEWVVFMVLCIYLGCACEKKGIWDRHIKMSTGTNLLISAGAAVLMFVFFALVFFRSFEKPVGSLFAAGVLAVIVFVSCFFGLTVSMHSVKKKQEELDKEPEEE